MNIWPATCPHEGASIPEAQFCEGVLSCPWHGRKFRPVQLSYGSSKSYRLGNISVFLEAEALVIRESLLEEESDIATKSMRDQTLDREDS